MEWRCDSYSFFKKKTVLSGRTVPFYWIKTLLGLIYLKLKKKTQYCQVTSCWFLFNLIVPRRRRWRQQWVLCRYQCSFCSADWCRPRSSVVLIITAALTSEQLIQFWKALIIARLWILAEFKVNIVQQMFCFLHVGVCGLNSVALISPEMTVVTYEH